MNALGLPRFPAVVDDVTVRLIAAVVLVVGLVALGAQQWWLYAVLAVDFTLRAGFGPRFSPVARLVQAWLRPRIPEQPQPTAGAPKQFAAGIGAVMTAAATALWFVHLATGSTAAMTALWVIGMVMVVFPALEALCGYCVGCRLFAVLIRVGLARDTVCVDCAPVRTEEPQPSRAEAL